MNPLHSPIPTICALAAAIALPVPGTVPVARRWADRREARGSVVTPEGTPVRGARVRFLVPGSRVERTLGIRSGASGGFVAKLPAGVTQVLVDAPGFVSTCANLKVKGYAEPAPIRIVLGRGGHALAGRVAGADGRAVGAGVVWAQGLAGNNGMAFSAEIRGGRFAMRVPDGEYRLHFSAVGTGGASFPPKHVKVSGDTEVAFTGLPAPRRPGPAAAEWIRRSAIRLEGAEGDPMGADLAGITRIVGDAQVVGLGEATHGTHEFQAMKCRIVKRLVAELGFTVFAIEDDYATSRAVNDFVMGGTGVAEGVVRGMDVDWWDSAEMVDLVKWLREWNSDPRHSQKVSFIGFDLRDPAAPFASLTPWIDANAPEFAERLRSGGFDLGFFKGYGATQNKVPKDRTRACLEILEPLPALVRKRAEGAPPADRSRLELDAAMLVSSIRQESNENVLTVRDEVMAGNLMAAIASAGPGARAIAWAHNGHVGVEADPMGVGTTESMGAVLKRSLGAGYVPIGFTFGSGEFMAWKQPNFPEGGYMDFRAGGVPDGSLDEAMEHFGAPCFALDFRRAGECAEAKAWLGAVRPIRSYGGGYNPSDPSYTTIDCECVAPAATFGAVIHFSDTSSVHLNKVTLSRLPIGNPAQAPTNLGFTAGGPVPEGWDVRPCYLYGSPNSGVWLDGSANARDRVAVVRAPDGGGALRMSPVRADGDTLLVVGQGVRHPRGGASAIAIRATVRIAEGKGNPGENDQVRLWVRSTSGRSTRSFEVVSVPLADAGVGGVEARVSAKVPDDADAVEYGFALSGGRDALVSGVSVRLGPSVSANHRN